MIGVHDCRKVCVIFGWILKPLTLIKHHELHEEVWHLFNRALVSNAIWQCIGYVNDTQNYVDKHECYSSV